MENGVPILDGNYLSQMSLADARSLFQGEPEIPLLEERHKILVSIGQTLTHKYDGRFHCFFASTKKDVASLVKNISREFAGFDDVASYHGRKISFYKKIQVFLSYVKGIENYNQLVGAADYKIPAVLRKLGILVYAKELADLVDNRIEIPAGSEAETEIRASDLWAIHLLCEKLNPKRPSIYPATLDGMLWNISQKKDKTDKPYHLTRTIFY